MDLRTIRERLKHKYYSCADECIHDFQRMICNVFIYNKPDSQVVAQAGNLEVAFVSRLLDMPTLEVEVEYTSAKTKSRVGVGNKLIF